MRRGTTLIVATITFLGCVASLTATPCAVTSPLSCGTIIYYPQPPTDFLLDVNDPVDPATLDASDFTLNGTPATSVTLLNNNTRISFTFNTSPAVRGNNTMHIAAGAFDCVSNGPVLEFICTFSYVPIQSRPRPTPYHEPAPAHDQIGGMNL